MNFRIQYDLKQYEGAASPVEEELRRRGHGRVRRGLADVSIQIQNPRRWHHVSGDVYWIMHGVSCTKDWRIPQALSSRRRKCVKTMRFISPAPYWTEVVNAHPHCGKRFTVSETGWPKTDILVGLNRERDSFRNKIIKNFNLDDKPIIAYFPTWTAKVHARREESDPNIICNILKDYNVLFCGHQREPRNIVSLFKKCDASVWESGIAKLEIMIAADMIITDTSSVAYEACIVPNRSVVLLDNQSDPYYLNIKNNKEGKFLDLGPRAYLSNLKEVVDYHIVHPEDYQLRRDYWMNYVLGATDGKCASRIVDLMEKEAIKPKRRRKRKGVKKRGKKV